MEESKETNHFVRVIIVGDETSEKSKILSCIKNQRLASIDSSHSSEDRLQYNIQFRENSSVRLDLLNHKQDRTQSSFPIRSMNLILLVFSYKDLSSFNNLKLWITEVERYSRETIPKIIIGNCFSHNDAIVREDDVNEIIGELGIPFARVKDNDIESIDSALLQALEQLPSLQPKATLQITEPQHDQQNNESCFRCTIC